MVYNSQYNKILVRWLSNIAVLMTVLLLLVTNANANRVKIVVLGDSLVAGYGLAPGEAFPERLQKMLNKENVEAEIVNAGVSGDSSANGLARLDWSVPKDTDAVILELGANDALRGLSPLITKNNLNEIITMLKSRGVDVMIVGMKAPPNLGKDYVDRFDAIYPTLAKTHDLMLYPFFLDGVAAVRALNQADGIHPTAEGINLIVSKILPSAKNFIERVQSENSIKGN